MIVSTPREALWAWINERIGTPWSEDFRAIGLVRGGCLVAVIAYNGFVGRSCCMHSAIDDPKAINRTFLRAIFEYPFVQCKLTHVIAIVSANNDRAMSIDKRLGFEEFASLSGAGLEGEDLVLLQMERSKCQWLEDSKHGKEVHTPGPGLRSGGREAGRSEQRPHHCADLG